MRHNRNLSWFIHWQHQRWSTDGKVLLLGIPLSSFWGQSRKSTFTRGSVSLLLLRSLYTYDTKWLSFATTAPVYQDCLLVGTVGNICCIVGWFTSQTVVFSRSFYREAATIQAGDLFPCQHLENSLLHDSLCSLFVHRHVLAWVDHLWIPGRAVITLESIWNPLALFCLRYLFFFFCSGLIRGRMPVYQEQQKYRK